MVKLICPFCNGDDIEELVNKDKRINAGYNISIYDEYKCNTCGAILESKNTWKVK